MSGSIEQLPSGNLRLRVYIGTDDRDRSRYKTKTIPACSDRAARKALAAFVVDCERLQGLDHGGDTETLGALLGEWLTLKKPNLSPGTFMDYERIAAEVAEDPIAKRKLRNLRPSHLDTYYASLATTPRTVRGKPGVLGPARIRRYHNVLNGALRQAVKWEWIDRNPAANATPPLIGRTEATAPNPDDLGRIIAEADDGLTTWLVLAAGSGMRPGELAALRWSDIDLDAGSVIVRRALGPAPKGFAGPGGVTGLVEKDTKTHRSRPMSLGSETIEVLKTHRRRAAENALQVGVPLPADAFVFTYEPDGSRPWRPDSAGARFRRITRKLGIEGLKPYGTRHFHATELLAAGVDVRTVAHRLGHARTSTTTDIYAHVVEAADRAAAETIDGIMNRTATKD